MRHSLPDVPSTIGADLRALRKGRALTLTEMAERLGRSVGWLSQVERDISELSITDLRQIADCLDVPVSMLFRHAAACHSARRVTMLLMSDTGVTKNDCVEKRALINGQLLTNVKPSLR